MWRTKIPYEDLPASITQLIPEGDLLVAYGDPEAGTVVLWTGTGSNPRWEREFSPAHGRFLTRAERETRLPAPREFDLPDQQVHVVQEHRLLPDSDLRYEAYLVYDLDGRNLITETGQEFFKAAYEEPERVIGVAVRQATFPSRYRGWSRPERINHWTMLIRRHRRWNAESGYDEDDVFTPKLWRRMNDIDPDVGELLPEITGRLARMWLADPDDMLAEFRRRTGA